MKVIVEVLPLKSSAVMVTVVGVPFVNEVLEAGDCVTLLTVQLSLTVILET